MPTYRWTFTCEEMYDDENNTVNITTKTLISDSETFTDAMILLPQLFGGVGFYIEPNSFSYKDEPFEDWSYDKVETQTRVLEREYKPAGFRGEGVPYADPGFQVTGGYNTNGNAIKGGYGLWVNENDGHEFDVREPSPQESVDHLAGFPPTISEE